MHSIKRSCRWCDHVTPNLPTTLKFLRCWLHHVLKAAQWTVHILVSFLAAMKDSGLYDVLTVKLVQKDRYLYACLTVCLSVRL